MPATPSTRHDVAVLGEALVDILVTADGTRRERVGGRPTTVARGLGRLGTATTLITMFGDDPHGRAIDHELARCGVRVVQAGDRTVGTSTTMTRVERPGEEIVDLRWQPTGFDVPTVDHLHVGSLAVVRGSGAEDVARLVASRDADTTASYDVGVRRAAMGPWQTMTDRVDDMISHSNIVKLSDADLAWLRPTDGHGDAVRWLMSRGPEILVLTHGGSGATGFTRHGSVRMQSKRLPGADVVDWEDAFMAGLLHTMTERELLGRRSDPQRRLRSIALNDLETILFDANRCAARAIASVGVEFTDSEVLAITG
ncbi:fructokinase [Rhodococcoides trifolii]|uniref:Fructokinase n=1 Tax=Rhodococcoides trifolii TaxID=908250 RepID=A0A917CU77_9NOCA|nr:PfkB family carbohydrate kinase [Rhodococcus trifolii]GGF99787.1 fructokinase [Rhodococcus trifolii]